MKMLRVTWMKAAQKVNRILEVYVVENDLYKLFRYWRGQ